MCYESHWTHVHVRGPPCYNAFVGFAPAVWGVPNAITLSCKAAHRTGAHRGMVAAATNETSEGAICGRHAAVQFGAARGGSAAGPTVRRLLSACEAR